MYRHCFITLILSSIALAGVRAQERQAEPPVLSPQEWVLHVVSRLSFGPNAGILAEVRQLGLEAWIDKQITVREPQPELADKLARYGSLALTTRQILESYAPAARAKETADERRRREALKDRPKIELRGAVLWRAAEAKGQVAEVMGEFWRNHFNIDQNKDAVGLTANEWDRSVIRTGIFGHFDDFLLASAKHPAMLLYLDNAVSRRPPTKTELKAVGREVRQRTGSRERGDEAVAIAAQNGLNENYAREVMELHTLGVDNGYSQKDVISVAEALTGWSVDRSENRFVFDYRDDVHADGDKFVLGQAIQREKKRNGMIEGENVLKLLAAQPATADFLAKKLCVQLVNDNPPEAFVRSVAAELRRTKLDLAAIVKYIALSDEMKKRIHFRAKFKTPFEFVVSALRITEARLADPERLAQIVGDLGQPIYGCEDPTGYRDTAESWRDPGVMAGRWRFSLALAANQIPGVEVDDEFFADVSDKGTPVIIARLCKRVLPAGMRDQTIKALFRVAGDHARAVAAGKSPAFALERRLLGVLLGSPEFQEQ